MSIKCKLGLHDIVKRTYYNEHNQPYYIEMECKDCGWHDTEGGFV